MAADLWRLVNIPGPTCNEREVALVFAQMLTDAGVKVEVDETIHQSPTVVGRLQGKRPGKTLQLAGHIDHIDVQHPAPQRKDNIISGRGSADMKNGLAGILEIVRLLNENDCNFPGEILVTVYGRHEAPDGDSKSLLDLIEKGIKGHAAIVLEGPSDAAMIMAKGQSIWQIMLKRQGPTCHELNAPSDCGDLLAAAIMLTDTLRQKIDQLNNQPHNYPLLGPESLFIGQLHYGDFYNRLPNKCSLQGTRRWLPNRTFEQIQNEFSELLQTFNCPQGVAIEHDWIFVGESYEISPDEPIVGSLVSSFRSLTDQELEIDGIALVTDACRLVKYASVPTIIWGLDTKTAHADYEYVEIDKMHKNCQIVLGAVLDYLSKN